MPLAQSASIRVTSALAVCPRTKPLIAARMYNSLSHVMANLFPAAHHRWRDGSSKYILHHGPRDRQVTRPEVPTLDGVDLFLGHADARSPCRYQLLLPHQASDTL